MPGQINAFLKDECGAVTVDWVMLTALIVGLNLIVMFTPIRGALVDVAQSIGLTVGQAGDLIEPTDDEV